MLLKKILETLNELPPNKLDEVLDFAEYLRAKEGNALNALRADFFWQDKQDWHDHYLILTILLILSEKGNSYIIKCLKGVIILKVAKKISPENFILSVLSPEDRLDAAFTVARQAFKKTELTMKDIDKAVKSIRRKDYEKKR